MALQDILGKYNKTFGPQAAMSGLGSLLFGNNKMPRMPNPANAAMPYLNQIPDTLKNYFNPYIQQGQQAGNQLNNQYGQLTGQLSPLQDQLSQMMNDPSAFMKKIGEGYTQSPGYQKQLGEGTNAAMNAAAATGMLGSPEHQQEASQIAQNVANQDYNQYLQNALGQHGLGLQGMMGLYGRGLQGLEGLQQQGYQAGTGLGENLSNALASMANMQYGGQANQNMMNMARYMQQMQQRGAMGGLLGNLFGSMFMG